MNDETTQKAREALAGSNANTGGTTRLPGPAFGGGDFRKMPANGEAQSYRYISTTLPPFVEMGDVGAALDVLLKMQAGYARNDGSYSRAMVDVAYRAVHAELENYLKFCVAPPSTGTNR